MPTLLELNQEIAAKATTLGELFAAHKSADGQYTHNEEQLVEIRKRNDELTDLSKKRDGYLEMERSAKNAEALLADLGKSQGFVHGKGGGQDIHHSPPVKSLGQYFTETEAYKAHRLGSTTPIHVEVPGVTLKSVVENADQAALKALLERSTGFAPFVPRIDRVEEFARQRPMVADLIPQDTTTASAIKYMEETTSTNGADTVSEGGTKPESALAFTERTVPVEKIATWLPVTDEQLADVPQLRAVIDNRLRLFLALAEEEQLLRGNGTSPDLTGFLNKTGVQTQAKSTDPVPDAVYKAFTKVRFTGFAEPSGVIFHPNDWQDVRLLRTADGLYIWGSPSEAGPERIWGKPIVVTTAMTENTALTGDFVGYSQIFRREGVRIEASNSHSTFFVENKLALRAEERLALIIYRGAAFAKITGI